MSKDLSKVVNKKITKPKKNETAPPTMKIRFLKVKNGFKYAADNLGYTTKAAKTGDVHKVRINVGKSLIKRGKAERY